MIIKLHESIDMNQVTCMKWHESSGGGDYDEREEPSGGGFFTART